MDTSKNDDSGESEKEGEETKTNKINLNKTDINVDINSKINEYTSPSTAADSNENANQEHILGTTSDIFTLDNIKKVIDIYKM